MRTCTQRHEASDSGDERINKTLKKRMRNAKEVKEASTVENNEKEEERSATSELILIQSLDTEAS